MKNKKSMSGIVIVLLFIGAMLFTGCDNPAGGGGGGDTLIANMESVTLQESLETNSPIYVYSTGKPYNGTGTIKFVLDNGTRIGAGTVSSGILSLSFPDTGLGILNYLTDNYGGITVSPINRRACSVQKILLCNYIGVDIGELSLETEEDMYSYAEIHYWYYNGHVTMSGSSSIEVEGQKVLINVNITGESGWNRILLSTGSFDVNELKWVLYNK